MTGAGERIVQRISFYNSFLRQVVEKAIATHEGYVMVWGRSRQEGLLRVPELRFRPAPPDIREIAVKTRLERVHEIFPILDFILFIFLLSSLC